MRVAVCLLALASCAAPPPCGTGRELLESRCKGCHGSTVTGAARQNAPPGVDFDGAAEQQRWAARIRQRTVVDRTMPPEGPLADCELQVLDAYLKELEAQPCQPSCTSRACGDDGCGGTCGTCGAGESCTLTSGQCNPAQCSPDCQGKTCGPDGCGGSCGACGTGLSCTAQGACVCVAQCAGRQCGPDGCSGSCGTCNGALICNTTLGRCGATCAPSCNGRMCGDDGCGGSCGGCPMGQACDAAGACGCAPSCAGKACGDDGCGGSCGMCASSQACQAGACTWPSKSFAADVHPLFVARGCSGVGACHGGARPAEGLNLSTAAGGFAQLVGVGSSQCPGRTRVVPNDIAASYLVNKLTGSGMCVGSVMPKGGSLTAAEIDLVRAWIATGANP